MDDADLQAGTLIRRETLLAALSETRGGRMARLERVLEVLSEDPGALEGLAPSELYFLLKDIGPHDAAPLLPAATDDQLCRLVDFDGWEGDRFSPQRFAAWLELAWSESQETASRFLRAADPEALALQIMKQARIVQSDKTPEQADELGGRDDVFQSPDMNFWVICEAGSEALPRLKRVVDLLYATDLAWARELLNAAAWELVSSLEHEALRFRSARLGEEGFPSRDEALRIYRSVDMKRLRELLEQHGERVRAAKAGAATRAIWDLGPADADSESLLSRALMSMRDGPRKAGIIRSLAHLLGEVVMAETGGDFSDEEGAARAPARLHGIVSAGLEHLAGPVPEDAATLLRRLHPRILFRTGYTLLLGIRNEARACLRRASGRGFRLLDEGPWRLALEEAAGFVPRIHRVLDDPGETTAREVRGSDDMQTLRDLVRDAAARLDFVIDNLGASPGVLETFVGEDDRKHVTCTTITGTALLDALVDLPMVTPLNSAQLDAALDLWMPWSDKAQRRVPDEVVQSSLARRVGAESPPVRCLVEDSVQRLLSTFERVPKGAVPDPRFLGAAVLVGEPARSGRSS